ncbi:ArsR/SmtB family transcription factor [Gemmatimonas phototrophica]|uniref:ArsR family transcriptional regulator n=1 Tax=Gemmatimonas phototrophica TaxID=1379270 RepID=A0A143BL49_9BACT|nr:metalloregulator ArsR/SmtB family transcription factor [Gemmatimonas phototrophica]AMW05766.1 ArsR family transcriptional regulator [Gemmatimonas phototrophica]
MTATPSLDHGRAAELFHALSDETRLGILALLRDGEQCVCDLQSALQAAQSRLSFHLRVLKDAGLVSDRKEGRWSYYTLEAEALGEAHDLVRVLASVKPATETAPVAGKRRLAVLGSCCG